MASVKVVAWVQGEPRKMVPVSIISLILDDVDLNEFMDVQMAFLILLCLYTYSRSESPCPKSHTGRESYDEEEHMNVKDIDAEVVDGKRCLKARFRKTKVDPRVQRPEAQGDGDWSIIGDVDDPKWSIVEWYTKLQRFHGHRADTRAPFFIEQANPGRGARPLIYRVALAAFKDRQRRVGVSDEDLAGLHGLRVAGWNGTKDVLGPELAQAHGGWATRGSLCLWLLRFRRQLLVNVRAPSKTTRIRRVVCGLLARRRIVFSGLICGWARRRGRLRRRLSRRMRRILYRRVGVRLFMMDLIWLARTSLIRARGA